MATENSAVFSNEEIGRAIYHTGHTIENPVLTFSLGVPALTQTAFQVYSAMSRVPESQAAVVRRLIGILEQTDNRIFEAQELLQASKIGEIEINLDVYNALEGSHPLGEAARRHARLRPEPVLDAVQRRAPAAQHPRPPGVGLLRARRASA